MPVPLRTGMKINSFRTNMKKPAAWFENWKGRARALEAQVAALVLASRHPRTSWYAKALALLVTAYALSPIDLIPDFIPVLGYLDDLVIVPFGAMLVIRMVPPDVMEECRKRAAQLQTAGVPRFRWMGPVVVLLWAAALAFAALLVLPLARR